MLKKFIPAAVSATTLLLPLAGHAQIKVDGTVDAAYGAARAVQNAATNYGNNTTGTAAPSGGGSELDAAYGVIQNGTLYITVTGNLENNGNILNLFFATGAAGGQNALSNTGGGTTGLNGLTFDTGVAPNYDLYANAFQSTFYASLDKLDGAGTSTYLGNTTTFGSGANGTLTGGNNPSNILAALNDSNVSGSTGAGAVTTGAEFAIPLSAIGSPTGPITVIALLAAGGNGGVSNQVLGPAGTGLNGYPNPNTVNFANIAGSQYFVVPAATPEPGEVASLLIGAGVLGGAILVRRRTAA